MNEPEYLSDLTVTKSGWIRKRENTTIMWIQVLTVVLAVVNIGLEATLQILESLGRIEHREGVISALGVVLVAVCFFTIPVRRRWAMIVNTGILALYIGYCLRLLVS